MKTSLTIEGTPAELARVLAMLGGDAPAVNIVHNVSGPAPTGNADDDESGDAEVAPGTVDKSGLPWDDRIHSTPAKLTTKGAWRAKRGVADQLVSQVEAELRARGPAVQQMQQPAPQYAPQPEQQMQQPVYQPPAPQFTPPAAVTMPAGYPAPQPQYAPQQEQQPVYQPPAPAPQQQPAAPANGPVGAPPAGSVDFMAFMNKVGQLSQQGLADAAYFQNLTQRISQAFNTPMPGGITELQKNQGMVDYAIQVMASEGKWI